MLCREDAGGRRKGGWRGGGGGTRPPRHVAGDDRCGGLAAVLNSSCAVRAAADCVSRACIRAPRACCSACNLPSLSCRSLIGCMRRCSSGSPPAGRSSRASPSPVSMAPLGPSPRAPPADASASAGGRMVSVKVGRRGPRPPACPSPPPATRVPQQVQSLSAPSQAQHLRVSSGALRAPVAGLRAVSVPLAGQQGAGRRERAGCVGQRSLPVVRPPRVTSRAVSVCPRGRGRGALRQSRPARGPGAEATGGSAATVCGSRWSGPPPRPRARRCAATAPSAPCRCFSAAFVQATHELMSRKPSDGLCPFSFAAPAHG